MLILKRLFGWIQYPLDWFYYLRKVLVTGLTFFAIRIFGFEDTWQEVWSGSRLSKWNALTFDESSDLDTLLAEARYGLATAEKRRASVVDKYKTLLTLGSILLATIGLLFPKWFTLKEAAERGIFVAVLIVLLIAVIVLLAFLGIGREKVVSIKQTEAVLNESDLKRCLINSYVECKQDVDRRTDFLLDVYLTARFYLCSALTLVVILFSIHVFRGSTDESETGSVIQQSVEQIHGSSKGSAPQRAYREASCINPMLLPCSLPLSEGLQARLLTNTCLGLSSRQFVSVPLCVLA